VLLYTVFMIVTEKGIRLEFSDGRPPLTSLAKVNEALAEIGSRIWPLDLRAEPQDIRKLLRQPTLTKEESDHLLNHFLLSRERLLEVITGVGGEPHVAGVGALTTLVLPHNYTYPQLYVVEEGIDYSRFDRFHVNVADDGTAVDEVVQMLSGSGFVLHQRLQSGEILSLHVDCSREDTGWILTYDGHYPHIGSISGAQPGTKALVQVIGPERWVMRYEDDL
jgi:hypothetical protein